MQAAYTKAHTLQLHALRQAATLDTTTRIHVQDACTGCLHDRRIHVSTCACPTQKVKPCNGCNYATADRVNIATKVNRGCRVVMTLRLFSCSMQLHDPRRSIYKQMPRHVGIKHKPAAGEPISSICAIRTTTDLCESIHAVSADAGDGGVPSYLFTTSAWCHLARIANLPFWHSTKEQPSGSHGKKGASTHVAKAPAVHELANGACKNNLHPAIHTVT